RAVVGTVRLVGAVVRTVVGGACGVGVVGRLDDGGDRQGLRGEGLGREGGRGERARHGQLALIRAGGFEGDGGADLPAVLLGRDRRRRGEALAPVDARLEHALVRGRGRTGDDVELGS